MSDDATKDISIKTKRHMLEPDQAKIFDGLQNGECGPLIGTDAIAVEICRTDNSSAEIRIRRKPFGSESQPQE